MTSRAESPHALLGEAFGAYCDLHASAQARGSVTQSRVIVPCIRPFPPARRAGPELVLASAGGLSRLAAQVMRILPNARSGGPAPSSPPMAVPRTRSLQKAR